jgi:drug/metabolite transporter (DMT)-like permease
VPQTSQEHRPLSHAAALALTALAMLAFAGNSLLCRLALKTTAIDPAAFTLVRLVSGSLMLVLIVFLRPPPTGMLPASSSLLGSRLRKGWRVLLGHLEHCWPSALALFAYAAAFSFAYTLLTAATGALLLFGAVQATMLGYAVWRGERVGGRRLAGALLAAGGLVVLLLPGLSAPPLAGALLMLGAGAAWGVYSLRGRRVADPAAATAANFVGATLMALFLLAAVHLGTDRSALGLAYAAVSGALTSGVGYVVWYAALRGLKSTEAAVVQLSVPVLAAAGGSLLLSEPLTLRLVLCAAAILGGISLVIVRDRPSRP